MKLCLYILVKLPYAGTPTFEKIFTSKWPIKPNALYFQLSHINCPKYNNFYKHIFRIFIYERKKQRNTPKTGIFLDTHPTQFKVQYIIGVTTHNHSKKTKSPKMKTRQHDISTRGKNATLLQTIHLQQRQSRKIINNLKRLPETINFKNIYTNPCYRFPEIQFPILIQSPPSKTCV